LGVVFTIDRRAYNYRLESVLEAVKRRRRKFVCGVGSAAEEDRSVHSA
jgi:hypothetical protein